MAYKKILLFISIFLMIQQPYYIFTRKKKDVKLKNAEELIEEKKFNDATKILMDELTKNPENEYYIMKLLNKIEKEKTKIIQLIYLVKENIEKGDFTSAEEILKTLENSGDFDETINKLIKLLLQEKDTLKDINNFNNVVTLDAEKNILDFQILEAYKNYSKALDIYRDNSGINNKNFISIINRFNAAEKKLFDLCNNPFQINEISSNESINILNNKLSALQRNTYLWKSIESDFISISTSLNKLDENSKKEIIYEAYVSITSKYIHLIRRNIQKNGILLKDQVVEILAKEIESYEKENKANYDFIIELISFLSSIEEYAFYKIYININEEYLFQRSNNNLISYLDHITKKNEYLFTVYEVKAWNDYNTAIEYYKKFSKEFIEKQQERDIFISKEYIEKAEEYLKISLKVNNEINDNLSLYNDFNEENFIKLSSKNQTLEKNTVELEEKIKKGLNDINSYYALAMKLLEEADSSYRSSINLFNTKSYSKAENSFNESKEKYVEVLNKVKSDHADNQLKNIDDYLEKIHKLSFIEEMTNAENFIEKAKNSFYSDNFTEAKKLIDEAKFIYEKHNQDTEFISYWDTRITTALKIQSGSKLTIDDSAYEEIMELFKNAKFYFNSGEYEKAWDYIKQILIEKPYYEEARIFEVKILQKRSPEDFERAFNRYYNEAKEKFNAKNYSESLIAFEQLIQFGSKTKEINSYIYQCKSKLNLVKPQLTDVQKNKARQYVKLAEEDYKISEYNSTINNANNALREWEDVPYAKDIKNEAIKKMGGTIKKVTLSKDNALKFGRAREAYSRGDYESAYNLCADILRSQKTPEVQELYRKADLKRKI